MPYSPIRNQDGFRLLFLDIQNHYVLARGRNVCRIQFYNNNEDEISVGAKPYSTVIIGANGIGKSFILSAIAEIFRRLKKVQSEGTVFKKDRLNFQFTIQYFFCGHKYKISSFNENKKGLNNLDEYYSCWEDDKNVGLHRCPLPTAVLASSITISDRFRIPKAPDGYYWYLGARNENSPGTTGTRTIVRKTVAAIAECLTHDNYFKESLLSLLEKLGFEPKLEIEYAIRYKNVYLKHLESEEDFASVFNNWESVFELSGSKRKTAPWGHKKFSAVSKKPENISLIVGYLRRIVENNRINRQGHLIYSIHENSFKDEWSAIQLLSQLDILSYPRIRVYKKASKSENYNSFLFEDSSTGETSLLCQFINLLSRIQQHSLILIDEPETSSHPNWQIHYIDWLNDIFSRFYTCHFVLSTHSHFLLSELEEGNSAIVALSKNDKTGEIENMTAELNTFGWSTDDILYEVFNIRNRRNEALARDLEHAMQLIDNGRPVSEEEKQVLLQRFKNVYQGERDPLGRLIKEFEEYAESRSK